MTRNPLNYPKYELGIPHVLLLLLIVAQFRLLLLCHISSILSLSTKKEA